MKLESKKFLSELMKQLPEPDGVKMDLTSERINVSFGENNGFYIRTSGGISCYEDTVCDDTFHMLHDEIKAAAKTVKEYLEAMENSPPLTAKDFDMPYKKLAECNNVVLGGTEHQSTGEFEFATWNCSDNGLYWRHYYSDYSKAKEEFDLRSGLVKESKLFNDKEMCKIYRCVDDTLSGVYELADEQTEILKNIQSKIQDTVANLSELLDESNNQEYEQSL